MLQASLQTIKKKLFFYDQDRLVWAIRTLVLWPKSTGETLQTEIAGFIYDDKGNRALVYGF